MKLRQFLFITTLMLLPNMFTVSAQISAVSGETIRMLIIGDVFSLAIAEATSEIEGQTGARLEVEVVGYDVLRELTLLNSVNSVSEYDIIAVDVVWVGEYSSEGILLPLSNAMGQSTVVQADDFLEIALEAGRGEDGEQLTLPIQPHPELLWYRTDLFEATGIETPQTTDDVLAAASSLHDPENGVFGICWNGQRGQALGQTMAHFYAAFGQSVLDDNGLPALDTPAGIAAAEYAQDLMAYSPPDILTMAWDQRILRFSQGNCAMTYGWAARTYLVEEEITSSVAGRVGYAGAPTNGDTEAVTPMGVWSLGIPANIGEREEIAWGFLEWFTSSETQQLLAEFGNGGMPRYSVIQNPDLSARYPAFSTVEILSEEGALDDWMRPAVPQWSNLADVMGTVFHDMLRGNLTPAEATAQAQTEALLLFE